MLHGRQYDQAHSELKEIYKITLHEAFVLVCTSQFRGGCVVSCLLSVSQFNSKVKNSL